MGRATTVLVMALLGLALLPGASHRRRPDVLAGASGAGDPYYPLDGNGGYDVKHYDLDLGYDPRHGRARRHRDDHARATQNLSRFDLDLVGLNVRSVKVDGRNAAWARDGQELVITPRRGSARATRSAS